MASSKPILCGPCDKGKVNSKAAIWCYNCDEGLCVTCSSHHKRLNGTHDQKTIDITSYKLSKPAIKIECDKHGQQLSLYCPSHLMPCCDECISTSHSKCTGIKKLTSVVEKTNIEKSKDSVETDINSFLRFFKVLVSNKSKNIKTSEHKYLGIKKSVEEIRKRINQHLDHLENELCQKADIVWNQEKSKGAAFISEIEGKLENLKEMKENVHTITKHNTPKLQSFLGVHQIEQQVHQFQKYADNLEDDERAKEIDLTMKQNDEIESIQSKLESIKSLGEVVVVKKEIYLNKDQGVKRGAQAKLRDQYNIHNMTMAIKTKIQINEVIIYIICLIDGRVIVVDKNGKVNLHTSDGKLQKHLPLTDLAWRVTQTNQNTIAITSPGRGIQIYNIEKETVTKFIELAKTCWGISFSNNSLAAGLHNDEITIIDLEGNSRISIQVQSKSDLDNFVYHNDKIIYSDYRGKAVTCIEESGKQIWQYKQNLSGPKGLCTDVYGNFIVADHESNRIIVISNDGQDSKVLISEDDGLKSLWCICLKQNESSGYICEYRGTFMAKFKFSYG
ncbi:uncharacterized protein [Mytilus edulis]|uniref:uncharacterized protein n=1 Tax=Mytilus edulis TaxID=6550 RepID=UPI0039EF19D3